MPATRTTVINRALEFMGEDGVTGIDEKAASRAAANAFDDILEAMLEGHPWNFASGERTLAPASETSARWEHVFLLPADCLVVREVEPEVYHEIKNKRLLADSSIMTVFYTRFVSLISDMPATFRIALSRSIATHIAMRFGKDTGKMQSATDAALRDAKNVDAQGGGRVQPRRPRHLLDARRW